MTCYATLMISYATLMISYYIVEPNLKLESTLKPPTQRYLAKIIEDGNFRFSNFLSVNEDLF